MQKIEIYYQFIEKVAPKYDANLTLVDVQTGSATEKEIAYLKNSNISIPTQAKWKAKGHKWWKKTFVIIFNCSLHSKMVKFNALPLYF
ncbi:MAG: hypothetical protein R2779_03060 [Crocinitomicaceae bacterium]